MKKTHVKMSQADTVSFLHENAPGGDAIDQMCQDALVDGMAYFIVRHAVRTMRWTTPETGNRILKGR
jgi:hypothetical protein